MQKHPFSANALADETIVAQLAQRNLTRDQLLNAQALVDAVEMEYTLQRQRKGETQASTQARDAALAALHNVTAIEKLSMEW